ncbi:hypothetical protein M427DRAFT_57145 [Gonapodya prolifera JEL478]|uniref:Magnesium transporter n=1 Tax=Gonapodya prolifera (strain JEL478) TaxID=1344416 RepID=A0A139ADV3_GONPJ|nr:hypothetical protein M427DRAFT_57145 [Gonapodya prolifera JEL478]|eukprot:KXS15006.1 hypothetical protein M427DRAFT_57145 [Gonapodya prolifera JEL478]
MSTSLARLALLSGFILLLHSAYSAAEHVAFLKAVDTAESSFPIEITSECLVGTLLAILGIVGTSGTLKPVLLEHEMDKKPYDSIDNNVSFRPMMHRRRARA